MPWEVPTPSSPSWSVAVLAVVLVTVPTLDAAAATANDPIDRDAAVAFVDAALWQDRGTAAESPDHIVFAHESLRILDALTAADKLDRVDPTAAADAAARLQTPSGGVLAYANELLGPWTDQTAAAVELADRYGADLDEDAAARFLLSMQNPDGGFAPRKSATGGNIASRVAATHHAVDALDALDALDETTRLEVRSFLLEGLNPDGGWAPMPDLPTSTTEATYHAVATLDTLGVLPTEAASHALAYLEVVERPLTGGFDAASAPPACYTCPDEQPTITATASALKTIALLGAGPAFDLDLHADWLASTQVTEGPNAGALPLFGPAPANPAHTLVGQVDGLPLPRPFPPSEAIVTLWSRNTAVAVDALAEHDRLGALDVDAASTFLADSQHEGTGGFGYWPGVYEHMGATAAAYRTLDTLDALDAAPTEALGETLADAQRDDGEIPTPRWDLPPRVDHTAHALDALRHADQLDAVDVDAAVAFLASEQADDGGFSAPGVSEQKATWFVVRALDQLDRLDAIDADAAAQALAALQQPDGRITTGPPDDALSARDTAYALRALAAVDRLDVVDAQAATTYLAGWQGPGGFPTAHIAGHAVLGLAAADALDRIDTDEAQATIANAQHDHGGLAPKGLHTGDVALQRHAVALEALDVLGTLDGR